MVVGLLDSRVLVCVTVALRKLAREEEVLHRGTQDRLAS